MLFLYLEEMRAMLKTFKSKLKTLKKKKAKKSVAIKIAHLKVMVKYLDTDYEETKKTLYPMLENGTCTFDLLWALVGHVTIRISNAYTDMMNLVQTEYDCLYFYLRQCRRAARI